MAEIAQERRVATLLSIAGCRNTTVFIYLQLSIQFGKSLITNNVQIQRLLLYSLYKGMFHLGFIIVFILNLLYEVYTPNISIKIEFIIL